MAKEKYPLEQVVVIKEKRLEEAEKTLKERKDDLEKENKKLLKIQQERDSVKDHKEEKLGQLRKTMDEGTTSTKIEQMKGYLKTVDDQLKAKENKVKEQQRNVEAAEKRVEEARKDLYKKQQDVEKLKMHKQEWEKEMRYLEAREEASETDEMGSAMHTRKKEKKKPKQE